MSIHKYKTCLRKRPALALLLASVVLLAPMLINIGFSAPNITASNGGYHTVWVDDDWAGTPPGSVVDGHIFGTDAFDNIQDGVDSVAVPGTVNVAAGLYNEQVSMLSGVQIIGEGAGNDPNLHSIIDGGSNGAVIIAIDVDTTAGLDGFMIRNGTGTDVEFVGSVFLPCGGGVYIKNSGPTISACFIYQNSAQYGGGIYNDISSSPTITGCTIEGNTANSSGGGMYNYTANPTVTGCTFENNSAVVGAGMHNDWTSLPTVNNCIFRNNGDEGMYNNRASSPTVTSCIFDSNTQRGMYNYESSPLVSDCTFVGNSAAGMFNSRSSPTVTDCVFQQNTRQGMSNFTDSSPVVSSCMFEGNMMGGMYNSSNSSPTVTNCTFTDNTANWGGGVYNYDSSPTVANCVLINNQAMRGGGMCNRGSSSPEVINCTFNGNLATSNQGGGIYNESSPILTNCILWGDTPDEVYNSGGGSPTITYSLIQLGTGIYPGTGNINAQPLFEDPGSSDFHLQLSSPCIDSGSNVAVPAWLIEDFEGDDRKLDGDGDGNTTVDMGADEARETATVDVSLVLQGGARPDPDGWEIPAIVKVFPAGSDVINDVPLYEFSVVTSKSGSTAGCQVTGIAPDVYDISVVSGHTLTNVKRSVLISVPSTAVDIGTLLEGNANNDHIISIIDFGMLSAAYGTTQGDIDYNPDADFDRSGAINISDFGLLAANYMQTSPIEIP
ncbi:MAG: right-handed parallel beta-helix repeat-containing protein [Chloroflexota bacterium]|nr:right-handed parallel beta-helix repeat-containing protein [Chloroflexota bacterium]